MVNCQGCHLPDGRGQPGKVPSLKGELARFLDVPGGRDFIVQVPGTANSKLSDADTAALLNWLVVEMGPPRNSVFVPFSAREVARLRSQRIRDASATRAALIAQFKS
jgi:mono/diheme cytochrome c family protein